MLNRKNKSKKQERKIRIKKNNENKEAHKMALIVRSRIKDIAGEFNVAGDFADALEKKAEQLVKDAIERARANNRRTVMGKDI